MTTDEQLINESLEENGVFEGEVYFSTDGKHTVHAKAVSPEGRKAALDWAFKAYQRIVDQLGTKAEMWEKNMKKDPIMEATKDVISHPCKICGKESEYKTGTSKAGKPWAAWFCTADKDHVSWVHVTEK